MKREIECAESGFSDLYVDWLLRCLGQLTEVAPAYGHMPDKNFAVPTGAEMVEPANEVQQFTATVTAMPFA